MTDHTNYHTVFAVVSFAFFVLAGLCALGVFPINWVAMALFGVACYVMR